jgi:sugar/nucleoside kinase (ribokinase family)
MASQVIVIGAAGIDTNIYLHGRDVDFAVESNFSENIDYVGQAGGYSARGYAQLGYAAAFIGYIGNDANGTFIQDEFKKDGIDSLFFTDPAGTQRSVNLMYADGRRKNFYDGKSSMSSMPDIERCRDRIKHAKLCHFSIVNWSRTLLRVAREEGCIIASDLQDVADPDDIYRRDYIEQSDVIFFSAANHADPEPLMRKFMTGNKLVICGMGKQGCALGAEGNIRYFPALNIDAPVIDTNGAGDGLAVGFLSSYFLENHSLLESITRGQMVARYTCALKASTSALITRRQLDEYCLHFLSV